MQQVYWTDANNHATSYQYDQRGRRTQRTLPLGQAEGYSYDAAGNVQTRTDFNGRVTTYKYDAGNRLLTKTADPYFAQNHIGSASVTYTYIPSSGQRYSMTDASGTTYFEGYDSNGHVTQVQRPQGGLSYTYDAAGNLTWLSGPSNTVSYTYPALNRLSTVKEANTGTTIYGYDNVGNLQTVTYPNGVVHTYGYDTRNRLTNLGVNGTVAGAPGAIASYAYKLDASGHRTGVTELSGRTGSYGYDNLYRLTSEAIAGDPNAVNGAVSYVYDSVGNRTQKTSTLPGYPGGLMNYNANDQLSTDTYDADGNATASNGNGYVYDFENHLVQQGGISIVYDGDGNRVSKTAGGVTTKYLVDTQNPTGYAQVVYETFTGGTGARELTHSYVYGLERVSEQRIYFTGSQSLTQYIYYVYDGHGSVRALTDPTGTVTDTYDYDAFGNLLHQTGTTPNNYLYSGEQFDPDLGFYYNRARYLNVSTGRFWSMDSYEGNDQEPLSLHKYLYASASPVNRVDPDGNDDLAEVSAAQGISEELDTQVSPAQALRAEAQAKLWDIYLVFGLGIFGGGGKFAQIPLLPIPHMYVYANFKGVNKGVRFDVGVYDVSDSKFLNTINLAKSLITTVPGYVQVKEDDLASVRQDSLVMKSWASLSALEFPLWRAGIPALASQISTGLQSLFPPSSFSSLGFLGIPYSVFGEGQLNCITCSLSAVATAKAFEKAPI
jgi:RHS repeat-associated protein